MCQRTLLRTISMGTFPITPLVLAGDVLICVDSPELGESRGSIRIISLNIINLGIPGVRISRCKIHPIGTGHRLRTFKASLLSALATALRIATRARCTGCPREKNIEDRRTSGRSFYLLGAPFGSGCVSCVRATCRGEGKNHP